MPNILTSQFPKFKDDSEFEEFVKDLFAAHWKDENVQIYGRSGQSQNGVDVYLLGNKRNNNITRGIQCKVRKDKLTKKEIEDEIKLARKFKHKIDKYIFVTTLDRDTKIQDIIDDASLNEVKNDGFEITISFWEDLTSLLHENQNIAIKYFPTFFGKPQRNKFERNYEGNTSGINEANPLLVGCLFDLSKSMVLETVNNLSKPIKFAELIKHLVFKVSSFCKSEDAKEIFDKFQLFTFAFGLGNTRKTTFTVLSRLGIGSSKNNPQLIPDEPIRDLFAETALKYSIPYTPKLSTLNRYWNEYQNSLERQLLDIGSGSSDLYNGLVDILERYKLEMKKPYYEYPLLILISNGKFEGCNDVDLIRVSNEIKALNVQIACFLIGESDLIDKYMLYSSTEKNWSKEVSLLFEMSSTFKLESKFYSEIIEIAKENKWTTNNSPKLFFQINQTEMLNELIEMIFKPLNSN
jgi:hypothetical protein